jgi:hypothetical protein
MAAYYPDDLLVARRFRWYEAHFAYGCADTDKKNGSSGKYP